MNQREALAKLEQALAAEGNAKHPDRWKLRAVLDWQWIILVIAGEEVLLGLARKWERFDRDYRTANGTGPNIEIIRGWICGAIGDFFEGSLRRAKAKGLLVMRPDRQKGGEDGTVQTSEG